MSIQLRLPGENKKHIATSQPYSSLVTQEIVVEKEVRAAHRSHSTQAELSNADSDDVLELGWADGIVELIRVGDLEDRYPKLVRNAENQLTIPTQKTISDQTRGTRTIHLESIKQIRVKIAALFAEKASESTALATIKGLEKKQMPEPGLYQLKDNNQWEKTNSVLPVSESPYLILIHGTFSSTAGSFDDLFNSKDWSRLIQAYPNRILALDHHTVSESPALNAFQLVSQLPKNAKIHLLTYSRGGLVGDLICRYPWDSNRDRDAIARLFSDPAYTQTRQELEQLEAELDQKHITVERFTRVAAPAAGTLLASKRIDLYLNAMLSVVGKLLGPGALWFDFLKAIALTIISTRTKADVLPGLEAMMPHPQRGFVPFLNSAEARGQDLAIIAGDVRGGNVFSQIKDFFSTLYYFEDNDFVVDSKSMFRGVPCLKAWGYYDRSPNAHHFSYFSKSETRSRMVDWLVEGRSDRFQPLQPQHPYGGLRRSAPTGTIPSAKDERRDRPVVFLVPGMMGTHLAAHQKRYWINFSEIVWGGLTSNLTIHNSAIEPDGLVETVYEQLYHYLCSHYNVIPFGFDWRHSIQNAAEKLAHHLQQELDQHKRPVRILAHSMGGLVARAFIANHPNLWQQITQRGGRLIMLGTPNYGSYIPAQMMAQQHDLIKLIAGADLKNSLDDLTDWICAFPGLIEMLPCKDDVNLLDRRSWDGFDRFRPNAAVLAAAKQCRGTLQTAIDPDHMIYIAGHHPATPASMERVGQAVTFRYTQLGDGTVPWKLGQLEQVETYYVNAEHGQLPNYLPAFEGYLDLLNRGKTNKLSTASPVIQRANRDILFDLETEEKDDLRYYPNTTDLIEAIAGRPVDLATEVEPPLTLGITNGDVREAKHAVIVGHYIGDPIVSVESVLDRAMNGRMSRDLRLGRYPGPHGTVRIYPPSAELEGGVIVAGLGEVGDLQRLELEGDLTAAFLEYALSHLPQDNEPMKNLSISSLLIGSFGGAKITIDDAVTAIVEAAFAANRGLKEQRHRVRIASLEIIELFRDIATAAGHAALRLQHRFEGCLQVVPEVQIRSSGRRSRPYSPYATGWSRRIRIRTSDPGLHFEVTTDLARSEPFQRTVQWGHIDALLENAIAHDPEAPATLFQYLLPYQFLEEVPNMPDLVLGLDPDAARIPWELLDPSWNDIGGTLPLGVRVGVLRTLSTTTRRENPRRASGRRALVIGEPANVYPPLMGARQEAEAVSQYLSQQNIKVEELLEASPDQIFKALYRHEYDIIHIAAHGQFSRYGPKSGVLLGADRFLTAGEFENLRAVPSIVFLNCCHLGKFADESGHRFQAGRLAASVAEHLIQMGVGVVVAAGWAVGDHAAKVFAQTLYEQLLDGNNLMNAVRIARAETYKIGGVEDLTWGAYQVYGDPGYTFYWVDSDGSHPQTRDFNFVSVHELHDHLQDFSPEVGSLNEAEQENLKVQLTDLEQRLSERWKSMGIIASAFGNAYANVGDYPKAIAWYQQAIAQSDSPIETIEQLAEIEGRAAEQEFSSNPTIATQQFEQAQRRLQALIEIQPTSERYCLRGEIFKRWAIVSVDIRNDLIHQAQAEYTKAYHLNLPTLYIPLTQKVVLDFCLSSTAVDPQELQEILDHARTVKDDKAYEAIAVVSLIQNLASNERSAEEIAQKYIQTWGHRFSTSPQKKAKIINPINTLVNLLLDEPIRLKIQKIRASLLKQLD